MNDYERRVRFAHHLASPLTTLKAGLELLERYALQQYNPEFDEVLDLLNRSASRLQSALALLNSHVVDDPEQLEIRIPDGDLMEAEALSRTPLAPPQPRSLELPGTPPPARAPSTKKVTVLLIEDSLTYRAVMSARLKAAGYEAITAADGPTGLDMARWSQPTVIILDLMLPELGGEHVAAVLSEDPETKHIPVVIYTALEECHLTNLDPRLHVIHKDQALDHLPALLDQLIAERQRPPSAAILVIDDDPAILQVIVQGLSAEGYSVTAASGGEEGLKVAQRQPFDLIILDVMMPDVDGWAVLQQIRAWNQTATTPVMLVSVLDHATEKVRGLQLGADDYVTKPFDWSEFAARIRSSLRRREMEGSANPTTMLPGNKAIERAIMARIETGVPYAVGYCDLDNFKAYNDYYGFLKGDAIIHQTARIITSAVEKQGAPGDFVGHIGGDDFVFVTRPELITAICSVIIEEFDRLSPLYYDPETRVRGTISQFDRDGNPKEFPLVSISIGVVSSLFREITHFAQVGDIAADIKKKAKGKRGSVFLVEGELI